MTLVPHTLPSSKDVTSYTGLEKPSSSSSGPTMRGGVAEPDGGSRVSVKRAKPLWKTDQAGRLKNLDRSGLHTDPHNKYSPPMVEFYF